MTVQDCENLRKDRHRARVKRLEDRHDLSLEISEDEAEYIEHQYQQSLAQLGCKPRVFCELFQVTTGVGL